MQGVSKSGPDLGVRKARLTVEGAGGWGYGWGSGGEVAGEVEAGEEGLVVAVVEVRVYQDDGGVVDGEGGGREEHIVDDSAGEAGGGRANAGILWGGGRGEAPV